MKGKIKKKQIKPWGGRFEKKTNPVFEKFSQSISFDKKLANYDLKGSLAQLKMLHRIGIINKEERSKLIKAIYELEDELEKGKLKFDTFFEDVHMNIEHLLKQKVGDIAGKIHTARSRNDQVALDTRLYLKDEIKKIKKQIERLISSLVKKAELHIDLIMPAYTHTRPAQPVLFSHFLLAYAEMFLRDMERLDDVYKRTDVLPLGSSAVCGPNFKIDRKFLAKELGFSRISQNSLDAVSDRDYLIEFFSFCSILMMHLSRLSEDIIWMSSEEFKFFELDESLCTGSTMMPNKLNPDSLELLRAKTGRIYGHLVSLLTVMKATPLAYNRDFQEDKEALFDTVDTVNSSLEIADLVIEGLKPNGKRMLEACSRGHILATDLADYLVCKGIPFRNAHHLVGELVKFADRKRKSLDELKPKEMKEVSNHFDEDAKKVLSLRNSVERKNVIGGTATAQVKRQIQRLKKILNIK